jgi:TolA-binding protein
MGDPNGGGSQGGSAASGGGDSSSTAASEGSAPPLDDSRRLSEPLRAERRKSNQLEKEIRTLRQQLNRFSEINPEEYTRLQEAERQMEEASAQKVAAVAAERDEAKQQILQLRKDSLLGRAFSQAEGRTGVDARGTFFDIFKGQLGTCFRLSIGGDGKDVLKPLDSQGKPLLGDDGRPGA